jgi:acyl-CoA synthetase (AMP-forming)/AMP-acid ligase II
MEFNLADLFESVADAIPDREALICGDRRLTYGQLDERATRVGNHLREAGIRPGDHVGLYLYNGTEYVETALGCLKIRAVPINVNYRYVEHELRYLFTNANLAAVMYQQEFAPRIAAVRSDAPTLRHFLYLEDGSGVDASGPNDVVSFDRALAEGAVDRDFEPRSGDDLFIIYTGGTTGLPRGVMWRQEDMFFSAMGGGNPMGPPIETPAQLGENAVGRDPQVVQFPIPPLIHGASTLGVFIGLNWGDRVVLIRKFDPELAWEVVDREKVNTITVVGDAMARPMAETLEANPGRWDTSSLAYLGSAGAILSDAVKQKLQGLLPNSMVTENFGATETGFQGMAAPAAAEAGGRKSMRFFMNDRSAVLDDDLQPVAPGSGVTGRLALKGRIPLGYYGDPEKTAATFIEVDGERWVLPGDLATVEADGVITVFGRGAVCINSGGEKVYPEEVESAVKAHPDVYDAVIVGVPDERWGERVAAVVQPREGRTVTLEDLDAHCRTLIAGYKVPRELHLVEQVARQPSGKPDYPWAKSVALAEREPAR